MPIETQSNKEVPEVKKKKKKVEKQTNESNSLLKIRAHEPKDLTIKIQMWP